MNSTDNICSWRKAIANICLMGLTANLIGCASTRGYLVDRGRDAADIFTATAGIGGGVQVRLGPAHIGGLETSDVAGLRYGNVFCHSNRTDFEPEERDFSLPALGLMLVSMFPFLGYGLWDNFGTVVELFENENRFPLNETQLLRHKDAKGVRASNSYQVEAAVGGGLVFRLGFNVGELLDFILGWTTIDIFGDDLESRESREPRKIIATATPPVVKENSLTLKAPFVTHFIKPRDAEKERQRKAIIPDY